MSLIVGWTGRVVCVERGVTEVQVQDNVVRSNWPESMALEELLSLGLQ